MKKIWPVIALGVGAFVVFALITLPASVVMSRLAPEGVRAAGVSGTVWHGRAQVLQIGQTNQGGVTWDIPPLRAAHSSPDGGCEDHASGWICAGGADRDTAGRISLAELSGSVPLGALPPSVAPGGWTGAVNMRFARLVIEDNWPVEIEGPAETIDLTGPARRPLMLGSYTISFPADETQQADTLVGALTDMGGPLQMTGTVQLKKDRSYVVEGLVATRPDAPSDVIKALQYLGPPDAQGRRQFSIAGSL